MKKYVVLFLLVGLVILVANQSQSAKRNSVMYTPQTTPEPTTPPPDITVPITLLEVSKHAREQDCWVAVGGSVYDMTHFTHLHPGGNALIQACGKEATELFNSVDSHTEPKRQLLQSFKIGVVSTDK
jgi:cytochrome b involved in lipid metabolism